MGIFGKRDTVEELAAQGFSPTRTLLDPPRLSGIPAIYQDENTQRWAVRYPMAEPVIFNYADILDCQVLESEDQDVDEQAGGYKLASQIIANPSRVSRQNAARRKNMCLGLGVVVAVKTGEGKVSHLQIPVITREVRRNSRQFEQLIAFAQNLKAAFDDMRGGNPESLREG